MHCLLLMIGVWIGAASCWLGSAAILSASPNAEDILAQLKSRDAKLNNVSVRYVRTGKHDVSPPWQIALDERTKDRNFPIGPMEIEYRSDERVTVRDSNITFETHVKPTVPPAFGTRWSLIPFQKCSNAGGEIREFTDNARTEKGSRTLTLTKVAAADSPLMEHLMEVEFALGLGFGKRIKEIRLVKETGQRLFVEGSFQLWRQNVTRFQMELDRDFVVRKAVIDADVNGNLTRYAIETAGGISRNDIVFAESGNVKRSWQGFRTEGKSVGKPNVTKEFEIQFSGAQFDLSDAEYLRLTKIDVPPDTMLIDHRTGEGAAIDRAGQKQSLQKSPAAALVVSDAVTAEKPHAVADPSALARSETYVKAALFGALLLAILLFLIVRRRLPWKSP